MICPSCGYSNASNALRCQRCAGPLQPAEDDLGVSRQAPGEDSPPREREGARIGPHPVRETCRQPDPATPRGVRLRQAGDTLHITRRWFHPLAFVVVVLLAPLLIWCGVTGRVGFLVSARYAALANVAATVLGVLCIYLLGVVLFNHTVIEITLERISLSHGPLPWILPRRVVSVREITRIFCVEHTMSIDIGVSDYDYELKASLKDGQTVSLLAEIPNVRQARFLERAIAHRLGIDEGRIRDE